MLSGAKKRKFPSFNGDFLFSFDIFGTTDDERLKGLDLPLEKGSLRLIPFSTANRTRPK
jgi:hypothetical protein